MEKQLNNIESLEIVLSCMLYINREREDFIELIIQSIDIYALKNLG